VTLYTVGSRKEIPDIRTYVFVDGGMGDNIRPSFYQSEYEAILADNPGAKEDSINTIAGKYCESGDILIKDAHTAPLSQGNILAVAATGAYAPAMASNYNMIPRPAIVMVNNGKAHIIRKRESYVDLIRLDNI
jgi:diaminopimelate decarboxylase